MNPGPARAWTQHMTMRSRKVGALVSDDGWVDQGRNTARGSNMIGASQAI